MKALTLHASRFTFHSSARMRLAAIWLAMACGMQVGMERALAQRPLGIDVSSYQHTITWPS